MQLRPGRLLSADSDADSGNDSGNDNDDRETQQPLADCKTFLTLKNLLSGERESISCRKESLKTRGVNRYDRNKKYILAFLVLLFVQKYLT